MGMTAATIIMHQGINTGAVFGHVFDFTGMSTVAKMILAPVICIVLCTFFTSIAGFFTAKFKMHPFISTMANMLMIFGLVTYATKGVSFGAIEPTIPNMIIPKETVSRPSLSGQWQQLLLYGLSGIRLPLVKICMQSAETRRQQPFPVFLYSV